MTTARREGNVNWREVFHCGVNPEVFFDTANLRRLLVRAGLGRESAKLGADVLLDIDAALADLVSRAETASAAFSGLFALCLACHCRA
jgi:hypothetical protein